MPTENDVKECSRCRATMSFISFIDRETGEEISGSSVIKKNIFLLRPFKKYRCSNGHTETVDE